MPKQYPVRCLASAAIALWPLLVCAADPGTRPPAISAAELMSRDLAGDQGKEALMLTVTYLPGGAPVTLHAGQTFYEGPDDIHRVWANASQTSNARILVFMIKDKGKASSRLVAGQATP